MTTRDDDAVKHLLVVDTHDRLLFFTNKGRVYSLTAFELRADTSRNTRGVPVVNVISAGSTENVTALIGMSDEEFQSEDHVLVLATSRGKVKRIALSTVANVRPSGYNMMNLVDDDELVSVRPAGPKDDIILVTRNGRALLFGQKEIRLYKSRGGMGVKGINLIDDDRVISMDVGTEDTRLLVISKLGFGKITPLSSYRRYENKGGQGVKTFKITDETGPIADAKLIDDSKEVYIVSEHAQVLRTNLSEIRNTSGRNTKGVTIFKPAEGDAVASISCVSDLNLRDDAPKPANSGKKLNVKKPTTNGSRNGRANGAQSTLEGLE